MLRIVHICTGLGAGGAETVLWRLAATLTGSGFDFLVVSLLREGPIADRLRDAGIPVRSLGMRRGVADVRQLYPLARSLTAYRADVVQTWMYHANLAGGLAAFMAGRIPCVWGVHHTHLVDSPARMTRLVSLLCSHMSGMLPSRIIYCADSSRVVHEAQGYSAGRSLVIRNGFDTDAFRPNAEARERTRRDLGIDPGMQVVGIVARDHPQKDLGNFFQAARLLSARLPRACFVLCGPGLEPANHKLTEMAEVAELRGRCRLLGPRSDVMAIYNAFDITTLSSVGEALPLVLGESMACGVPCVATDVGDCAKIVGDTGLVVPPGSPEALAAGWHRMLSLPASERRALGQRARLRIIEHYSIEHMAAAYARVYEEVAEEAGARGE